MLTELSIKNFAIIDDLTIPFSGGLNIISGETGAGKSIIIEALSLICGDKSLSDVIRSGEKEAFVTARFCGKKAIVVERTITEGGRSKGSINGHNVSMAELRALSISLLEISSQHEHQTLLNDETHLLIIDRFGALDKERSKFASLFERYAELKGKLDELRVISRTAGEQVDFLSFQIKEIAAANFRKGEEEELQAERNVVKNASNLADKLKILDDSFYSSEESLSSALDKAQSIISSVCNIDPSVSRWKALSQEASAAVSELSREVLSYREKINVDPSRLDEIETRLYEIQRLKKKYGHTLGDILSKKEELTTRLKKIENCDEEIKKLEEEISGVEKQMKEVGVDLSRKRKTAARLLSSAIEKELCELGLKKTSFVSGHEVLPFEKGHLHGFDKFSFLISPNQGEPLKPLSRIASGGELSRILLAIKCVFLDFSQDSLEVFDEVDVGIGGAVAEMVGKKLKKMSKVKQVICITHLPQVASFGDHHILVSKKVRKGRTITDFMTLKDEMRVDEIARMLGGTKITKTTIEHAKEMLMRSE